VGVSAQHDPAADGAPVVVSCRGGSVTAQLAEEVAATLAGQGRAVVADMAAVVRGEFAGRTIAAVDGCSSACGARLLAAKGFRPDVTLSLDDLGRGTAAGAPDTEGLATAVAGRIAGGKTKALRRIRPRRPGSGAAPAENDLAGEPGARSHTPADYLRAIDSLTTPIAECGALATDTPTLAAYVSNALGVTRVSAGAMLARLESLGLVERNADKEVLLTSAGRAEADEAVRRLRLLECMVTEFLGYPLSECRGQARALANSFDLEAIERVRLALGDPERCPHGWPIDAARARAESEELVALQGAELGVPTEVARLAEDESTLLALLDEIGVRPGAEVTVVAADARGVALRIGVEPEVHVLPPAAGTAVIVAARVAADARS
jgi:DtxR family Mn-dependent transcriptional regulator